MKTTEDKITVRKFKDGSSNFWVGYLHLYLNQENEICFASGGILTEEHTEALKAYVKRNKVTYCPSATPEIEVVQKTYDAIMPFGEFKGQTVSDVFIANKKLLTWMWEKYTFKTGEEKLKEQIKEVLKK